MAVGSDEIAFWRGFIEWWVRERDGPVPPRAWEALATAEAKGRPADDAKRPASRWAGDDRRQPLN